jgi:hypothetical protein
LPFWHFDGNDEVSDLGNHLDITLVLQTVTHDRWLEHYNQATMPEDIVFNERMIQRLGLLETTYALDQERDLDAIKEDWWYKHVRLV